MRCQGCGKKLKTGENMCSSCGFYNEKKKESLENDELSNLEYFKDPNTQYEEEKEEDGFDLLDTQDMSFDDDNVDEEEIIIKETKHHDDDEYVAEEDLDNADFLGAFVGEDYKWIVDRPINIYALLLSWMYFLYRKLYLIGILGMTVTTLVFVYARSFLPIFIIISMLASAVIFNPIYLWWAKRKVQGIIDYYGEQGDSYVLEVCAEKGGVSTAKALLIFLVFLVIMALGYVTIKPAAQVSKYWKDNVENEANCLSVSRQAYNQITEEKEMVVGTLEEAACEVLLGGEKSYDIYLKIKEDGVYRYVYFENEGKYLDVKGDTKQIDSLEKKAKDKTITEEEEKTLSVSKTIGKKFTEIKNQSNQEASAVKKDTLTQQRTNFCFTKDEVFKPAKKK